MMKIINFFALVLSIICFIIALIEYDYSEAAAWTIIILYNSKDFFNLNFNYNV